MLLELLSERLIELSFKNLRFGAAPQLPGGSIGIEFLSLTHAALTSTWRQIMDVPGGTRNHPREIELPPSTAGFRSVR